MNNKYIEIKEQRKDAFVKEILFLVLAIVSLTAALLPFILEAARKTPGPFFLLGGVAFAVFATLFLFNIFKDFKPNNALILNPKGFIDIKNVGDDIEIEWTNVSTVKLLGKGSTPFLGISLENIDIIMEKMKRNEAEIIRENLEDGLPAILISQSDVKTPIKQLRDIVIEYVKESRTLYNDSPKIEVKKEKKHNPFTTTAVLRAFGQTPENNKEDNTTKTTAAPEKDSFYDTLQATYATPGAENKVPSPESIVDDNNESLNNDDMPEEIRELLSRAKSSKISELGKILAEKDTPYSLVREEPSASNRSEIEHEETHNTKDVDKVSDEPDIDSKDVVEKELPFLNTYDLLVDDEGEISTHLEMKDFVEYVENNEEYNDSPKENDDITFETQLDSMLKTAFDNTREETERQENSYKQKSQPFTNNEFFPDLITFNDSELDEIPEDFNAERKYSNNEPTDFITNIDDD